MGRSDQPDRDALQDPQDRADGVTRLEQERQTLQERISASTDAPLALLALVWVGLLVAELTLDVPPDISRRMLTADYVIWGVFALDFALEFWLAPHKLDYLRGNVLAALSVLVPFVRVLRIFRLVAALRTFSLVRVLFAANRATHAAAVIFTRNRLHYVLAIMLVSVMLSAAGAYYYERDAAGTQMPTFGESLWWAATMATTINTSIDPVTLEARLIGMAMRVLGLTAFGYLTASIASYLVEGQVGTREEAESSIRSLERLAEEMARLREEVQALATDRKSHRATGDSNEARHLERP